MRERVLKPLMPGSDGGSPDAGAIRAARSNIKQHLKYTNWLAGTRNWLAGPRMSYADLAAAGTLSILDYLGEIDWTELSGGQGLVHAPEVAPFVPPVAQRPRAGPLAGLALRGPGFLMRAAGAIADPARLGTSSTARQRRRASICVAVTKPDAVPEAPARLADFLAAGRHGSMSWIAETAARRGDPKALWPEVRSIIMLGMNYGPSHDPLEILDRAAARRDLRLCAEPRLS